MAKIPGVHVREVSVQYNDLTSMSYTVDLTPLKFATKVVDSHNAYDPITGIFVAPRKGVYIIDFRMNQAGGVATYAWVNGVRVALLEDIVDGPTYNKMGGMVYLEKGDLLTIRIDATATPVSGGPLYITNQSLT